MSAEGQGTRPPLAPRATKLPIVTLSSGMMCEWVDPVVGVNEATLLGRSGKKLQGLVGHRRSKSFEFLGLRMTVSVIYIGPGEALQALVKKVPAYTDYRKAGTSSIWG